MLRQKTRKRNNSFKTKYNKVSKYREKLLLFPVFFCSYFQIYKYRSIYWIIFAKGIYFQKSKNKLKNIKICLVI